jgi:hypothetical protein
VNVDTPTGLFGRPRRPPKKARNRLEFSAADFSQHFFGDSPALRRRLGLNFGPILPTGQRRPKLPTKKKRGWCCSPSLVFEESLCFGGVSTLLGCLCMTRHGEALISEKTTK